MLGEKIKELLYKAVEFLDEAHRTEALFNMLKTFIIQLLATLVLFLIVRFFFWNKITKMIETRKAKIDQSLKEKAEAEDALDKTLQEAKNVKLSAKQEATSIINDAKKQSQIEANAILNEAHEQIAKDTQEALALVDEKRKEMEASIKDEIVDVAIVMAEKIVEHEVDKKENSEIIKQTLSTLDDKKKE